MDDVALRALEPEDIDLIFEQENRPDIWKYSSLRGPISRNMLRRYIETYDQQPLQAGQIRLIVYIISTKEVVGIVDLYDIDCRCRTAKVAIMILQKFKKKGYASKSLSLLHDYAIKSLGLRKLAAETSATNYAAIATFEKAGYVLSGRLKNWWIEEMDIPTDLLIFIK